MMSEDEMMVLRLLKKEMSLQNHITNKTNGTVSTNNRGRKKATTPDAPVSEHNNNAPIMQQADAHAEQKPKMINRAPWWNQSTTDEPLENQLPKMVRIEYLS
jgi:hypothetical protein